MVMVFLITQHFYSARISDLIYKYNIFNTTWVLLNCFHVVRYAIVRLKMQSAPDDLLSYTFATFPSLAPSHLFSGRACALHTSKRHFLTLSTSLILSSSPFPGAKCKLKKIPKPPAIYLFLLLVLGSFGMLKIVLLWDSNSQSADP